MFIAPLFTTSKLWKQPKCPHNWWMDFKNVGFIGNAIFFFSTEAWTQSLHFEPLHQPFSVMGFFEIGSCGLFALTGLEPRSSWSLPPEYLGTHTGVSLQCLVYTMKFYSAIKNEIWLFADKWMKLENVILNEVSQAQKAKGCIFFSHMRHRDV
jgi:hypothetical protein